MVNLHLSDFLVLVSCDPDEGCLLEHVGPEGRIGKLEDITGPHKMESRLVLVHRVQDGLQKKNKAQVNIFLRTLFSPFN